MDEQWKSIPDFATKKGVSTRTVYREIADGNLETVKVRRRRLITPEAERRYDELKTRQSENA